MRGGGLSLLDSGVFIGPPLFEQEGAFQATPLAPARKAQVGKSHSQDIAKERALFGFNAKIVWEDANGVIITGGQIELMGPRESTVERMEGPVPPGPRTAWKPSLQVANPSPF